MAQTALRRGSQEEGNSEYFTGCPIGGGFMWFGLPTKIPSNCMICDNSTLAISNFAKLNENLGGAWGTSGGNLKIPDLRGRFPRGVAGGSANDPDRASRLAANTGGLTGDAVGSVQDDAAQGHGHNVTVYGQDTGIGGGNTTSSPSILTGQNRSPNQSVGNNINANITSNTLDNGYGSPRLTTENRPKNANVYFVIRVS